MKVLIATRSQHKMREIEEILGSLPGVTLTNLSELAVPYEEVEEDIEAYPTFEQNAVAKAHYFAGLTGLPTISDDSGLEVEALQGGPGVRTKRFAPVGPGVDQDRANNRYLVQKLAGLPPSRRGARYVCVAAFVGASDPEPVTFRGEVGGIILDEPAGQGGFGYDPFFFVPEIGMTFAQADAATKNALSHRGRAFKALREYLEGLAPS
ncbi:MAG: non-canonical purine NTP pyrophosphatase [Gemmatimonadota bacterium]